VRHANQSQEINQSKISKQSQEGARQEEGRRGEETRQEGGQKVRREEGQTCREDSHEERPRKLDARLLLLLASPSATDPHGNAKGRSLVGPPFLFRCQRGREGGTSSMVERGPRRTRAD
jgi:hypothetical protein